MIAVLAHGAFNFTAGSMFPILPVPAGEDAGGRAASVGAEGPVPFLIFTALLVVLLRGRNVSYNSPSASQP